MFPDDDNDDVDVGDDDDVGDDCYENVEDLDTTEEDLDTTEEDLDTDRGNRVRQRNILSREDFAEKISRSSVLFSWLFCICLKVCKVCRRRLDTPNSTCLVETSLITSVFVLYLIPQLVK